MQTIHFLLSFYKNGTLFSSFGIPIFQKFIACERIPRIRLFGISILAQQEMTVMVYLANSK